VKAALLAFAALLAAGPARGDELRRLREETAELERRSAEWLRLVPATFDPAAEQTALQEAAAAAKLELEIGTPMPPERLLAPGQVRTGVELHRLEVTAQAELSRVHALLAGVAGRARPIDLETLSLKAEARSTVRVRARLVFPTAAADAAEGAGATLAADLRRRQATSRAVLDFAARCAPARLLDALAALARESASDALALTVVQAAGGDGILEGAVLGRYAQGRVHAALELSGFDVSSLKFTPSGSCQAFMATVRVKPGDPPKDAVAGNGLFDERTAAVCAKALAPSLGRAAATPSSAGAGPLTLHLRDLDLPDVFRVLNELTRQSFVVDPSAAGRLALEAEGAGLDDVLAAVVRAAKVTVGGPPLRRVLGPGRSPSAAPASPLQEKTEPFDLSLKDTDVRDLLCLLSSIGERKVWVPRTLSGTLSFFATGARVEQVLDAASAAVGDPWIKDRDRVFLGPATVAKVKNWPGAAEACAVSEGEAPRLVVGSKDLERTVPEDLELAGTARVGDRWKAWAYGPARLLWALEPGQDVHGGLVVRVGPGEAVVRKESGAELTLTLTPASR
jgi:hypothetical protein